MRVSQITSYVDVAERMQIGNWAALWRGNDFSVDSDARVRWLLLAGDTTTECFTEIRLLIPCSDGPYSFLINAFYCGLVVPYSLRWSKKVSEGVSHPQTQKHMHPKKYRLYSSAESQQMAGPTVGDCKHAIVLRIQ